MFTVTWSINLGRQEISMENPFSLRTPEDIDAVIASVETALDGDRTEGRMDRITYLQNMLARARTAKNL